MKERPYFDFIIPFGIAFMLLYWLWEENEPFVSEAPTRSLVSIEFKFIADCRELHSNIWRKGLTGKGRVFETLDGQYNTTTFMDWPSQGLDQDSEEIYSDNGAYWSESANREEARWHRAKYIPPESFELIRLTPSLIAEGKFRADALVFVDLLDDGDFASVIEHQATCNVQIVDQPSDQQTEPPDAERP